MCYNKPEAVIVLGEDNMEIITSVNNQRVKDVANLKQKKYRTETGAFFAEGLRAVIEAVQFADLSELFFIKTEENTSFSATGNDQSTTSEASKIKP